MNSKKINNLPIIILLQCSYLVMAMGCTPELEDYTRFVDPFIGTQHQGHTFSGAAAPLGLV